MGDVRSLERKGLVKGAYIGSGDVEAAGLTLEEQQLLAENPNLRNPIDWKWIIAIGPAMIGAITGIVALILSLLQS